MLLVVNKSAALLGDVTGPLMHRAALRFTSQLSSGVGPAEEPRLSELEGTGGGEKGGE